MATNNGALMDYADYTPKAIFFSAENRSTKIITIKSGQVLKALSFLETDSAGKAIARGGLVESSIVTFSAGITTGQTVILAGLTFTAGSGSVTAAQLADIWSGITAGATAAVASAIILAKGYSASVIGTFTSGTMTGYTTTNINTSKVRFDATTVGAATDVAITGTGAAAGSVAITQYAALNPIAGVTAYDVDASGGDVDASVYTEASFWATALVWAVDVAVDTITLSDNTTKAVTAYNTGCAGTSAASDLLKQKFVENTKFEPLGFLKSGELY